MSKLFSSPIPAGCRFTSGFGMRTLRGRTALHAGTDWGPPTPGQAGVEVRAASSGRIEKVGRGDGSYNSVVAPYHSGVAVRQRIGSVGGDYLRLYYGHLDEALVSEGDYVEAGDLIGIMGGSGPSGQHDFAIHLHFGVMQNASRPVGAAKYYGAPGWIDSRKWLESKGVTIGEDEPLTPGEPAKESAAASGSSDSSSSHPSDKNIFSDSKLDWRLDRAGYNPVESITRRVAGYQGSQLYGDLVKDGIWGDVTEAHYQWSHALQEGMNQWKGKEVPVDGDYRKVSEARVWNLMRRNNGGAYKGKVDGVPGPVFCRMLGVRKHPKD